MTAKNWNPQNIPGRVKPRDPITDPQPGDTCTHYAFSGGHTYRGIRRSGYKEARWKMVVLERDGIAVKVKYYTNVRREYAETIIRWINIEDWETMCVAKAGADIFGSWHWDKQGNNLFPKWKRETRYVQEAS